MTAKMRATIKDTDDIIIPKIKLPNAMPPFIPNLFTSSYCSITPLFLHTI